MFAAKDVLGYHRKRGQINPAIRRKVMEDKSIVYGGHALNAHLPPSLDRHTEDYDIYDRRPMLRARQLERQLDRKFGGDFFAVKRAKHRGTFRIMSRITESEVADYTRPERKRVPAKVIGGVHYVTLPFIEQGLRRTLKDPESKYRHPKDRDALRRIRAAQAMKRRR